MVHLTRGTSLRGKVVHARGEEGKPVWAFLGVPFAEPPTGSRRFQKPQTLNLWQGERDAQHFGEMLCNTCLFYFKKRLHLRGVE